MRWQYRSQYDDIAFQPLVRCLDSIFDKFIEIWKKISQEVNYNIILSERGTLKLIQGARDARACIPFVFMTRVIDC